MRRAAFKAHAAYMYQTVALTLRSSIILGLIYSLTYI